MEWSLRTARLLLRRYELTDAPAMLDAKLASEEELKLWMPWAKHGFEEETLEGQKKRIAERMVAWVHGVEYNMGMFLSDGSYVGDVSLHARHPFVRGVGIGYWLATPHTGQGYMTEALLALTAYAFEHSQPRVWLVCDANNAASEMVMRRCGFELEGRLKNAGVNNNGQPRDTLMYAHTPASWKSFTHARSCPHTR